MIVLLNVLLIGGLIFAVCVSTYLEWAMIFDGGFQIVPLLGIMTAIIGHCIFLIFAGTQGDTDEDFGKTYGYSILISCAIFGVVQSMFYSDTFIGEDGFGGTFAIIILSQPLKCLIGFLVGISHRTNLELKMKKQLSELQQYYKKQIDAMHSIKEIIRIEKENDISTENLVRLFSFLDCPQLGRCYRDGTLKRDESLIHELQKIAADVHLNIMRTDMTVSEIEIVAQDQLQKAQSKEHYYEEENFKLSNRYTVANEYKKVLKKKA